MMKRYAFAALLLLPALFHTRHAHAINGLIRPFLILPAGHDSSKKAELTLYFEIDPGTINFKKDAAGKLRATLMVQVQALGEQFQTPVEEAFRVPVTPALINNRFHAEAIFQRRYALPPGRYSLQSLVFQEEDSTLPPLIFTDSVEVFEPGDAALLVQPIEPGAAAEAGNAKAFSPLMLAYLDSTQHTISFTSQYQTPPMEDTLYPLSQRFWITRANGRELRGFSDTVRLTTGTMLGYGLISGGLDIAALPTGNYYLHGALMARNGQVLATAKPSYFQRENPSPTMLAEVAPDTAAAPTKFLNLAETFIAKFDAGQRRAILKMMIPVAGNDLLPTIRMLQKESNPANMGYFIYNYFSDLNPQNPAKAWDQFAARVREVNKLFGPGATRPGYETDRGQMWLKYGKPTDRYQVGNDNGAKPYEVWRYPFIGDINRTIVFLFVQDGLAATDYRLMHSTHPAEIQNPGWGMLLFNGNNDKLQRSRALQYMSNQ